MSSVYLLCGILLVPFVHCQNKQFYFINMNMTWTEARQYCRDQYTDLATVERADDMNRMGLPGGVIAWIGLFDDPASWKRVMNTDSNSWRWSATGTVSTSRYQNWATGEPSNYAAKEDCVFVQDGSRWRDYDCQNKIYCVCYTVQSGAKEFVLVHTSMNWADSVAYCRQHYHDLAMIENSTENQAVLAVTGGLAAWIGLYREPWRWSDNSNSSFRNWANGEPNNAGNNENCTAQNSDHLWCDLPCTNKMPFICHKVLRRSVSIIKVQLQSNADLTDPAVMSQILKQFEEQLEKHNNEADFKLKWSVPPTKQEKGPEKKEDALLKKEQI